MTELAENVGYSLRNDASVCRLEGSNFVFSDGTLLENPTMKHHGCKAALLAVLVALLVGVQLQAQTAAPEADDSEVKQLLKDLKNELQLLRQQSRADRLLVEDVVRRVDRVERSLERLQERIERLPSTSERRSAILNATATLRLDNRLPVRATVIIDGISYVVPPFGMVDLPDRAAGVLNYQVTADGFGLSGVRSITLYAGQTRTLTINY